MRPASLEEAVGRTIEGYGFMDATSEFLEERCLSCDGHKSASRPGGSKS